MKFSIFSLFTQYFSSNALFAKEPTSDKTYILFLSLSALGDEIVRRKFRRTGIHKNCRDPRYTRSVDFLSLSFSLPHFFILSHHQQGLARNFRTYFMEGHVEEWQRASFSGKYFFSTWSFILLEE